MSMPYDAFNQCRVAVEHFCREDFVYRYDELFTSGNFRSLYGLV
jgi:hypothetical protein